MKEKLFDIDDVKVTVSIPQDFYDYCVLRAKRFGVSVEDYVSSLYYSTLFLEKSQFEYFEEMRARGKKKGCKIFILSKNMVVA